MQLKTPKKGTHNALQANEIKTLFYTFFLLTANVLAPQTSIAQEKTSSDEVVIGYGTVKKSNLTGAVTEINVKDLTKAPVYSFTEALGGRAAGLQVSAADGQPGEAMNILIRNINSLHLQSAPLFVIDRIIVPEFQAAALNPEDIEGLNILKDGAATAIYGVGAANGVVLIHTKKGKVGAPVISFNNAVGFQQVTKKMELMSPYEFVKYQAELGYASAASEYFTNGKTLASYVNEEGIDWQDQIFRRSLVRSHHLSFRGGSSTTKYALSGANFDQEGVVDNSGAKNYQSRIALDQVITDKISMGVNASYNKLSKSGYLLSQATSGSSYSYLNSIIWSYRPVSGKGYDLINSNYDDLNIHSSEARYNPVAVNKGEDRNNEVLDLLTSAYVNYQITEGLTFRAIGAYLNRKYKTSVVKTYLGPPIDMMGDAGKNESIYKRKKIYWSNDYTLTYDKAIGENHQFNILGGFAIRDEKDESVSFLTNGRWYANYESKYKSYFGRLFYGYKSRYLFEAIYRADKNLQAVNHHSSGAFAWNMLEEDFLKNNTDLSASKLRMSYGKEKGSRQIADQFNIGYDLGLFNNRITLAVDIYKRTIENFTYDRMYDFLISTPWLWGDIFSQNPDLTTTGTRSEKIQNKGLEFNINTVNVSTNTFTWQTSFNINFGKNKILQLSGNEKSRFSKINFDYQFYPFAFESQVGQAAGAMYGYTFDGIYQYEDFNKTGSWEYILKDNIPSYEMLIGELRPGDIKYKDINGDGFVNEEDAGVIGNGLPVHTGGFTNNFTYKNFDLNIFFQWSYGNDIYNANRLLLEGNGKRMFNINQFASYSNRWSPDNPSNENFRAGASEYHHSSRVVEDGSYLRLKTASLAYNVPINYINKLHLSKLQLHITGQNLLTFTKYSGMDPEVSVRNSVFTPGIDMSAYPQARTLMFGINASF